MIYKGYDIKRSQPSKRVSWRIYKNGRYLQTCTLRRNAKRLIDFMLKTGVWE